MTKPALEVSRREVGHVVEAGASIFCSAHCAEAEGVPGLRARA